MLAVDVGGSHVKVVLNGLDERRRFTSGPDMTAQQMVDGVRRRASEAGLAGARAPLSASPSAEATGAAALKETSKPSGARSVRMID